MRRNLCQHIPDVIYVLGPLCREETAKEIARVFNQQFGDFINLDTADIRYLLEKAMDSGEPIVKTIGNGWPKYELMK